MFGHLRHLSTVTVWPLAANKPRYYDDSFETTLSGSASRYSCRQLETATDS